MKLLRSALTLIAALGMTLTVPAAASAAGDATSARGAAMGWQPCYTGRVLNYSWANEVEILAQPYAGAPVVHTAPPGDWYLCEYGVGHEAGEITACGRTTVWWIEIILPTGPNGYSPAVCWQDI
jgi:hypothetical protein